MRCRTISDLFQFIHNRVDADLIGIELQFNEVTDMVNFVFQNSVNAVELRRDRARAGSSGHP
jgi:hypothetical protein